MFNNKLKKKVRELEVKLDSKLDSGLESRIKSLEQQVKDLKTLLKYSSEILFLSFSPSIEYHKSITFPCGTKRIIQEVEKHEKVTEFPSIKVTTCEDPITGIVGGIDRSDKKIKKNKKAKK